MSNRPVEDKLNQALFELETLIQQPKFIDQCRSAVQLLARTETCLSNIDHLSKEYDSISVEMLKISDRKTQVDAHLKEESEKLALLHHLEKLKEALEMAESSLESSLLDMSQYMSHIHSLLGHDLLKDCQKATIISAFKQHYRVLEAKFEDKMAQKIESCLVIQELHSSVILNVQDISDILSILSQHEHLWPLFQKPARLIAKHFLAPIVDHPQSKLIFESGNLKLNIDCSDCAMSFGTQSWLISLVRISENLNILFDFLHQHISLPPILAVMGQEMYLDLSVSILCLFEQVLPLDPQKFSFFQQEVFNPALDFEKKLIDLGFLSIETDDLIIQDYLNNLTAHFLEKKKGHLYPQCQLYLRKDLDHYQDMEFQLIKETPPILLQYGLKVVNPTPLKNAAMIVDMNIFPKCKISVAAFKLGQLIQELWLETRNIPLDLKNGLCDIIKTLLDMFLLQTPKFEQEMAVLGHVNDCAYLYFVCRDCISLEGDNLLDYLVRLHKCSEKTMNTYLTRTNQTMTKLFDNIDSKYHYQFNKHWEDIASEFEHLKMEMDRRVSIYLEMSSQKDYIRLYTHLIDIIFTLVVQRVYLFPDISVDDCNHWITLLRLLLTKDMDSLSSPSLTRYRQLLFILDSKMIDVLELWKSGDCAFTKQEIIQWIQKLFTDNDLRRSILAQIQGKQDEFAVHHEVFKRILKY